MSNYLCPYCLEHHLEKVCDKYKKEFPDLYLKAINNGAKVYPILFAGKTQKGKTTFMYSLLYSLAVDLPSNITNYTSISQESIDQHKQGIDILSKKLTFPEATQRKLSEPIILSLKKESETIVLIIFDTKGGIHENIQELKEQNILDKIKNIIFLIDFESTNKECKGSDASIANELWSNLQPLKNATNISEINIAICLTKMDKVWGNNDYGVMGNKSEYPVSVNTNFNNHYRNIEIFSDKIENFFQERNYKSFLEIVHNDFGGYGFFATSNIGNKVLNQTFDSFSPKNVIDPILWVIS